MRNFCAVASPLSISIFISQYFHTFDSKVGYADFEEDQRRFYSKPREEFDCPNLLFGLKELTIAEKTEIMNKISSIVHAEHFFSKILGR